VTAEKDLLPSLTPIEHVAIKALQRQDIDGLLASEAKVLLKLHHAHVIRLFQVGIPASIREAQLANFIQDTLIS
jgi:hypothetical protein